MSEKMVARWEPLHEAHSIEIVGAGFTFSEPLSEVLWRRVLRVGEQAAAPKGLTNVFSPNSLEFQLKPGATPQVQQVPGDMHFQRLAMAFKADKTVQANAEEELVLGRANLIYRARTYTRWVPFLEKLTAVMAKPLEVALLGAAVAAVRLEYRDRFNFSGVPTAADPGELLRRNSRLIAPHVFDERDLWHSHTGMFIPATHDAPKRLVQISIDAADLPTPDGPRRSVGILTAVQDNLIAPGSAASQEADAPEEVVRLMLQRLTALHDFGKEICRELVNDEIAERIGLESKVLQ